MDNRVSINPRAYMQSHTHNVLQDRPMDLAFSSRYDILKNSYPFKRQLVMSSTKWCLLWDKDANEALDIVGVSDVI